MIKINSRQHTSGLYIDEYYSVLFFMCIEDLHTGIEINEQAKMKTSFIMIFFAFILFFSNASIAYRIYSSPYEQQHQGNLPGSETVLSTPNDDDFTWSQYVAPKLYQMLDRM